MVGDRLGQSRSGWGGVRNGGQNSILGKGQAVGKASVRVLGVRGVGISWAGAHGKNGEFSVVAEGSRCCQAEEAWICVPASA